MTCARSFDLSRRTKLVAATCSVVRLASMLALLSSSSDSAIGCCSRLKNVTSCLMPSSNTEKSGRSRSVTNLLALSVTVTFSETTSTPARKAGVDRCRSCAPGAGAGGTGAAGGAGGATGAGAWADDAAVSATRAATSAYDSRRTSGAAFAARGGAANREIRPTGDHLDLRGWDERLGPSVDDLVLRRQLARDPLHRLVEAHRRQQRDALAAGRARPFVEQERPLADAVLLLVDEAPHPDQV